MKWVFLGYAAIVSAAVAATAAAGVRMLSNLETVAVLLLLPSVVTVLASGLCTQKTGSVLVVVRVALEQGLLRRRHAIQVGAVAGALCVGTLVALSMTTMLGTASRAILGVVCGLVLLSAPACACGWLAFRAKQLIADSRGFPVVQSDAGNKQEP